jgi:hypothetical protein
MQVEQFAVPKRQAQAELDALKQAVKQNTQLQKEQLYKDLQKVYGHMKHGAKVLDVYASFKAAGLNADGDPKLAICRADAKICYCLKQGDGAALFSMNPFPRQWSQEARSTYNDVALPKLTFQWRKAQPDNPRTDYWNIKKPELTKTTVPIIPAKLLSVVTSKLSNYHILWEVEKWTPEPPRDPILLKQLTPNLYGVLATWDLTPLERAIIRGRIQ